jgi:hypothetical protein
MRALALLLLSLWCSLAAAQFTPPAQHVYIYAPQLRAFSGSDPNFESLASGLTLGQPVTLTTMAENGRLEIASFTAAEALAPADTARLLEAARQRLIAQGVGQPRAAQIAVALMGGTLVTPSGTVTLSPMIAAADPKHPLQVGLTFFSGSRDNYARLSAGLSKGSAITLNPTTAGGTPVTFVPPGGPMTDIEVSQTLNLASALLASQGLYNPTPEQVRSAIVGGSVTVAGGRSVLLRGVIEGRTQPTATAPRPGQTSATPGEGRVSDSPAAGRTSDTPATGHTSDSPPTGHTSDRPASGFTSDRPAKK